MNVKLTS